MTMSCYMCACHFPPEKYIYTKVIAITIVIRVVVVALANKAAREFFEKITKKRCTLDTRDIPLALLDFSGQISPNSRIAEWTERILVNLSRRIASTHETIHTKKNTNKLLFSSVSVLCFFFSERHPKHDYLYKNVHLQNTALQQTPCLLYTKAHITLYFFNVLSPSSLIFLFNLSFFSSCILMLVLHSYYTYKIANGPWIIIRSSIKQTIHCLVFLQLCQYSTN